MSQAYLTKQWTPDLSDEKEFGLYLHIPFCSQLCHYCDFAKTANFDHPLAMSYFAALQTHLEEWLAILALTPVGVPKFTSLFWGGGTPGLFDIAMEPIFKSLKTHLVGDAEITLEANPANINPRSLEVWKRLGFNRLSIGVQTFSADGLKFLKRDHSASQAEASVNLAHQYFDNISIDLIYGWQGQTMDVWQDDLRKAVALGTAHLSLYNLIYESRTPIGRAMARGLLQPTDDELDYAFYIEAGKQLAGAGFVHDEVSNWAKPGRSARHNWLYWQSRHYLGIGSGAHGFIPAGPSIGTRYSYHGSERHFIQNKLLLDRDDQGWVAGSPSLQVEGRDELAWLMEFVGSALRCRLGVDTRRIESTVGWRFEPTGEFLAAEKDGLWSCDQHGVIRLCPSEWFRENSWSLLLINCFKPPFVALAPVPFY